MFKLLNMLSVDVALGAVVCSAFFAKVLDAHLRPIGLLVLGLSVWIIYAVDHLLDVRKTTAQYHSDRHGLYKKYFRGLAIAAAMAIVFVIIALTQLRPAVVESGLVLAPVVILYLIGQRKLRSLKELSGAILYTAGVLLIPLSISNGPLDLALVLLIAQFGLTALNNLVLFAIFDLENDIRHAQYSIATSLGKSDTIKLLITSLIITIALGLIHLFLGFRLGTPSMIVLLMNIPFALILIFAQYFRINERFRLLGDIVFLFPLVFLFS